VQRRIVSLFAGSALLVATVLAAGGAAVASVAPAALSGVAPVPLARVLSGVSFATPPTTAQCEKQLHIACYAPFQYHKAYNLAPLYKKGFDGKGQTIVIVDSFGYQFIRGELAIFDKSFGLPAPPSFKIIRPAGPVPPYNPKKRPAMTGWAQGTSLDVQYAHAMAPGANILLVETSVAENPGRARVPADRQGGELRRQSPPRQRHHAELRAPEQTFPDAKSILNLRSAYRNAAANGVSVLGSSGDSGATGPKTLTAQGFAATFFLHRVVSWPATDPLVTAVGGTQMHLTATGAHIRPDTVWNDTKLFGSPAAGSGGRSIIFARPSYQNGVAGVVGSARGVPDISMSAAVNGAALVYLDAKAAGGPAGFYLIGGTSEASPLLAGVVAIADQYAGHGLGLLNPALYKMAADHEPGIVDVTKGSNTVTFPQNGSMHTVRGWRAVKGYDLASGLGTINAALFVPELAAAASS